MQDSKMETPLGNEPDTGADVGNENRGGNPKNGNPENGRRNIDPHGNRGPENGNRGRGPYGGPGPGYYNQGGACGDPGYPPPPPCEPGPGCPPPERRRPLSVLSIVGFVFVFLNSLVGLVLSIIAYNEAKAERDIRSRNLSKAGIITAVVLLVVGIFTVVSLVLLVFMVGMLGAIYA